MKIILFMGLFFLSACSGPWVEDDRTYIKTQQDICKAKGGTPHIITLINYHNGELVKCDIP